MHLLQQRMATAASFHCLTNLELNPLINTKLVLDLDAQAIYIERPQPRTFKLLRPTLLAVHV
jgi:hypothetical protein